VFGATSASGVTVSVNSSGQLGTNTSSRRFKEDIRAIGSGSDGLMRLQPVSFHYKSRYVDGPNPLQYGLIAEQVAKVYPELVAYGRDGEAYTVRYQELPALLLAKIQEQQRQIGAVRAENRRLERQVAKITGLELRLARLERGG
jgi:hypothetical protein